MSVIPNTTLLVRRINDAVRRRTALQQRRAMLDEALPDWAFVPLRLAGLSAGEVDGLMQEQLAREADAGMDRLDQDIEQLDAEIERAEEQLLNMPALGLDGTMALLTLGLDRLRQRTVTDSRSVFYDHGDARTLSLVERACGELGELGSGQQLRAG